MIYSYLTHSLSPFTSNLFRPYPQGDNLAELWLNFLLLESDQDGSSAGTEKEKEKGKQDGKQDGKLTLTSGLGSPRDGLLPPPLPSPREVPPGLLPQGGVSHPPYAQKTAVRSYSFTKGSGSGSGSGTGTSTPRETLTTTATTNINWY